MEPHDVTLITPEEYPALFEAFERISHDCGRQAGHVNYAVPRSYLGTLTAIDHDLGRLLATADSDFACLCIGDVDEAARIVKDYQLAVADELLQRFFEEFC